MPGLAVARDLKLPIEIATEAVAILARRSRGKTYTASVLAEELHAAGQPFVVLDPVGVWWGLRSSADGRKPGLQVTILGGDHGDLPLETTAGALLATFVVDHPAAYVLDLSGFESKGAQDRFVTDFAERIYRYKAAQERRVPLTLIVDEADQFAPQNPRERGGYMQRMIGAFEAIVRQGRARGLGCVLITQRPAVLNKNVLTQAGALVLLGITGPQDRDAIDDWVKGHADPEARKQVIGSLAGLGVGEAWVWWPTENLLKRIQVRRRRTFDSSATPKAGEKRAAVRFADVNLDTLKDAIADTVERAKADDPKLLQARVRELETELRQLAAEPPQPETVVEKVPVLDSGLVDQLQAAIRPAVDLLDRLTTVQELLAAPRQPSPVPARPAPAPVARTQPAPRVTGDVGDVKLGKGEKTVLAVLAEYPEGRTYKELAFLAKYSSKASTLGVILANLRRAGLIEPGNQPVRPTDAGLAAAGGAKQRPTGPALLEEWLRHPRMGEGERNVLLTLVGQYPKELTHDELCELTGYSPSASTMGVILSKLRKLGLVEKRARMAAPEFMDSIR